MAKEPTVISGKTLVEVLERVSRIMKEEVKKMPDLSYEVAAGGLKAPASLAIVFTFDPDTLRHVHTKICSEKRAAKEWNKAHGIAI